MLPFLVSFGACINLALSLFKTFFFLSFFQWNLTSINSLLVWDEMQSKFLKVCGTARGGKYGATTVWRSWDEMEHEILVEIMKRLPWDTRFKRASLVSKTWMSAVLDSMSPVGVLNLEAIDSLNPDKLKKTYCNFLKRLVDHKPADYWSALFLPETFLRPQRLKHIAKRTPSMQQLIIPRTLGTSIGYLYYAMPYWKELKKIECPVPVLIRWPDCFQKVKSLRLFGVISDTAACTLRDRCPSLERLSLESCALAANALSTILDAHKDLELLDTRHSFRVPDCSNVLKCGLSRALPWNEEEIRHKAAGIKVHLKCTEKPCALCDSSFKCCFPELKARKFRRPIRRPIRRRMISI